MYIDTHCHLSSKYYNNIDEVLEENVAAGVSQIIISCCDKEGISEGVLLTKKYDNVYLTVGYHPDEVGNVLDSDLDNLKLLFKTNKKIVGVGEIGLDYHYGKENRLNQIELFEKQLKIAEDLKLPVVVHSRDAVFDTINCLKKYKVSGIIHCFSGSLETANVYISMGFKLGIGGVITFKNSKLGDVIRNIKLEDIVLETDSPYLTPDPFRGRINSSKYIPIIAEKVSDLFGIDVEKVAEVTVSNTLNIFYLQ